jgi:nucleoside-diphosphate-sugar epimerase
VTHVRILVTDVTGLVGRSVARQLVAAGHAVSGIAEQPHDCLDPDVDFACAPLHDPVLQRLADEAEVVLHLAPVETSAPGAAGINGVARVSDAAARAGDRLLFVSQAAGLPAIYRPAERLVSTSWAPNLIVRAAPPVGRQLDWMVCRTVATLLHTKVSSLPVRLLHLDDLVRFLVLAVASNRTGVVDLATPDTTNVITARRLLEAASRSRHHGLPTWFQLTPALNTAALQEDWKFEFGWQATEAVADTSSGLAGRRLGVAGAVDLAGHVPLPVEAAPRRGLTDDARLLRAAPEGLEGEFDDRINPRFPVFKATGLTEALRGPLTPMTLDVQLAGLRSASRIMTQVMTPGSAVAAEWGSRAIAVFGHRPYAAVSTSVLAAAQLPGWDQRRLAERALGGQPLLAKVLPADRPPSAGGMLGSAAKAVATGRALALLRHLKSDTSAYSAAATLEHVDLPKLTTLSDAHLETRIQLLRSRVHQGWNLTALWVIDSGVTATLAHTAASSAVSGIDALIESQRVVDKVSSLAVMLRRDPQLRALAANGDLDGIRAMSRTVAAAFVAAVARIRHRGPGEAELANPTFGDDPALLLRAAADAAEREPTESASPAGSAATLAERMAANARASREFAYDTTMQFTHELRTTLRELGSRRVSAELIDTVGDVYYLTCDELLTMPPDARLRIKRRRAERERLQALRLPIVIDQAWAPLGNATSR